MSFSGKTIETGYFFRGTSGPWKNWNWGDVTVGAGAEIGYADTNNIYSIDFAGKEISIRFDNGDINNVGVFSNYSRNGPVIKDFYDVLNPMIGFTLKTNMHGLTKSDITVWDNELRIDWRGTSFTSSTYVLISVKFKYEEITGTTGNDIRKGTKYDDILYGKKGADILTGGKGADHFIFSTGDTGKTKATADLIKDFKPAEFDVIDISRYDGNSTKVGIQDFKFIGTDKFSKTIGELRYAKVGSETHITGDMNGDGKVDMMIRLSGKIDLTADHFIF